MPYGALVQWHRRTQVCGLPTPTAAIPFGITGFPPCAAGTVLQPTPYMSMFWQVPVAGGPLAVQPPDIHIVEAAAMQQSGTALRHKDEGTPPNSASRLIRRGRFLA
jgi:hypothetical protein